MKRTILIFISLLLFWNAFSQQLFYSDIVYGGVTGNGGSVANGAGTINFPVQIPPNSTIKKAYLLAARDSLADDITVTLNGFNYTFSDATVITNGFNAFNNGNVNRPNSSIHVIDITTDIDSSVNNYTLTIPPPSNSFKGVYTFYYLYIVYENLFLSKINCNLFLNTQDVAPITFYNLNSLTPINNNKVVGLAVNTLQFCDTIQDGSFVAVNGNTIGLIGGEDLNSNMFTCVGAWANFAHYNDSLIGLDDDTPDSLMGGTDALADIKSYVNNGDTAVNLTFTYQSNFKPFSNPIRAVMLSYTTPCDTFTTSITANDTICLGDSLQLQATGGVQYSWFGAFNGLSDTSIANPVASPPQTTTYIVTIKNDSGCVKTEQVKIWVNPLPVPDTLMVTNNFCGDSVGSLQVGNIPNGTSPFNYTLTNLQTGTFTTQSNNVFNQLSTFNFQLLTVDANGCTFTDTATVTQTNNVQSNFTANPQNGIAPLNVDFMNTSLNANSFEWWVMSGVDTLAQNSSLNPQHLFKNSGTYQVCLVAYNNIPTCADTICKTIIVADEINFVIPNVFTPNNDYNNDNFTIQLTGASLIKSLKVEVFNRWGETVKSGKYLPLNTHHSSPTTQYTIWDGRTTVGKPSPSGTYFYVITYTTTNNKTKTEKGTVTLLR